jgi:PilZ domain
VSRKRKPLFERVEDDSVTSTFKKSYTRLLDPLDGRVFANGAGVSTALALRTKNSTVLALEPDVERAGEVRRLVCDFAQARLTLVRSKEEFLGALDDSLPDLILLPALLAHNEESQLLEHLRSLPNGRHVQVMVTPFLFAADTDSTSVPSRGWRRMLTKTTSRPRAHACDPRSFAENLTWALQLAKDTRQELAARLELNGNLGFRVQDRRAYKRFSAAELLWLQVARIKNGPQVKLVDLSAGGVLLEAHARMQRYADGLLELVGESRESVCSFRVLRWEPIVSERQTVYRGACAFTKPIDVDALLRPDPVEAMRETALAPYIRNGKDKRERDHRLKRCDVPWLSTVKLSWGLEVDMLDISRTGMLIETSSRFTPGTTTEFQLSGPDTSLAVPARFVRSEVAAVGARGVKYHAAVTFAKELQLQEPVRFGSAASAPRALADLLTQMLGEFDHDRDRAVLRTKFLQGLRRLVPARDIQIANEPASLCDGTESIYFSVPGTGGSPAVLQATFEPDYELSEVEFRFLQTAAAVASVVLELERTARHS